MLVGRQFVGVQQPSSRAREFEQRSAQGSDRREALIGIARHRPQNDGFELGRKLRLQLARRRKFAAHDALNQGVNRGLFDRPSPRNALIQNHAQRILIRPVIDVLGPLRLLRRHVLRSAQKRARTGQRLRIAGVHDFRDAEVEHLGPEAAALFGQKNILGLEIAVHYPDVVSRSNRGHYWQK